MKRSLIGLALLGAMVLPAAGQQAPPPGRLPRDGFPMGPPAKILSFAAEPGSIKPGQSVVLRWVVVNADRITRDQGIGLVTTRGSRTVFPSRTTTYTLTALGYGPTGNDTKSATVTVAGTTPAPAAPSPTGDILANRPIPRLPDGTPDLSGIYIAPFMSIKPTGKVQLKPGAEKFRVGPDYEFSVTDQCLPPGVPEVTGWPYPLQIVHASVYDPSRAPPGCCTTAIRRIRGCPTIRPTRSSRGTASTTGCI